MVAAGHAVRVLVVDHAPLVRRVVMAVLAEQPDLLVVGESDRRKRQSGGPSRSSP